MARDQSDTTPIETQAELVAWVESGCKPNGPFLVGTEHEKIPFYRGSNAPVPYEGPRGIRALLEGMARLTGWEPILEGDHPIGLADPVHGGAISLEPGGQFELSGAPLPTIHDTKAELDAHLTAANAVATDLGIGFLALGHSPLWSREETPFMPKGRYRIMAAYMPKVGGRGLDMMLRTATVQANLDFASEADMVRKTRVALALQPVATALFAASPFVEGRPSGSLSTRSEIWRDTDGARTGMMPFAFEPGFGFEAYVEYALDVPMYFVKRGETYHDVSGASFRDLLAGRLPALPGERATMSDWANHLSTIFPEVRIKRYLEMRGADAGPAPLLLALPAFWTGLLYDSAALDGAWELVRGWSAGERQALRDAVPGQGLRAPAPDGRTMRELARDVLALSRAGLTARAKLDASGRDEAMYLDPLDAMVEEGATTADRLLASLSGSWGGEVAPLFEAATYDQARTR